MLLREPDLETSLRLTVSSLEPNQLEQLALAVVVWVPIGKAWYAAHAIGCDGPNPCGSSGRAITRGSVLDCPLRRLLRSLLTEGQLSLRAVAVAMVAITPPPIAPALRQQLAVLHSGRFCVHECMHALFSAEGAFEHYRPIGPRIGNAGVYRDGRLSPAAVASEQQQSTTKPTAARSMAFCTGTMLIP